MLGIAEGYPNFANIVLKVFTVRKTRIQTENISFLSELSVCSIMLWSLVILNTF